jgi:hypothetical protein
MNETGGQFATVVNDTSSKLAADLNYTGRNLSPVSTTPAVNLSLLPLVLVIPVAN